MEVPAVMVAFGAALLNCGAQTVAVRYRWSGLLRSVYLGFVTGLTGCLILLLLRWIVVKSIGNNFDDLIIALATYTVLSYCYFHFINLGETARRIRLLHEIDAFQYPPTSEMIVSQYGPTEIYQRRIERLIASEQIMLVNNRFVLKRSGMDNITKIMEFLRQLVYGNTPSARETQTQKK